MNLAQALGALEDLAGQLNLPGGMDGWETLARQLDEAGGDGSEPRGNMVHDKKS